ncbi:MAG: hypothetical protein ACRDQ7_09315 [Haloechinothrix sp.]
MTSALSELTSLCLARPGCGADRCELAAWFDRLAVVHEHLAAESHGAEAESERRLAAAAHGRALAFLAEREAA